MTSGVTMLQLFQPGVAIMAQQLLGNHTLMQVRVGVILLLSPSWSFKSRYGRRKFAATAAGVNVIVVGAGGC